MSAPDLKEYEVEMRATVSRKVTIRAASHHEAASLVRARQGRAPEPLQLPGRLTVEEVRLNSVDADGTPYVDEEWEIFSWCESCDAPLFCDDEVRGCGDEGGYLCVPCYREAVASDVSEDA